MIQLLLEKGADPNLGDNDGRTPLAWAAEKGREETVKILLENGANVNSTDNYGQTPLSWAENRRPYCSTKIPTAVVKNLLEYGADPNLATGFKYSEFIRSAKSINTYEWDACSLRATAQNLTLTCVKLIIMEA
jgi:ankyrin repeat protein